MNLFKNCPKRCPRLKGPKALQNKSHYPLISMLLKCKDWTKFRRKQRPQKYPNCQVMAIFARSPKTRIFRKGARGGPWEIFQKSPKKQASFETGQSALAQMILSSNQYALKVQRLQMILALTTAPKVPEWPSYANFRKVTQNLHFLKNCKRGTNGNFLNNAQKVALLRKSQKLSCGNGFILQLVCAKSAKTGQDFSAKSGSKSARIAKLWQFLAWSPKTRIFLKRLKGGSKEIFQKSPTKQPSFEWPQSPLAQMALSSNLYALKVQRLEKILAQTPA